MVYPAELANKIIIIRAPMVIMSEFNMDKPIFDLFHASIKFLK